jgi:lipoprotein-anchoring transpeptidase ErfK/SrfK
MAQPARLARWHRGAVAIAGLLAISLVSACGPAGQWQGGAGGGASAGPNGPDSLTVSIAAGAKNVSPVEPVKVDYTGTLDAVTLANSSGKAVKGELDAEHHSWLSTQPLGYNKTYTLTISGTGSDGTKVDQKNTFSTIKPKNLTLPYLRANPNTLIGTGNTFGVGQPIVVWFDEPIKDKLAAEKQLIVTTDPPVAGAWHWFDNREVHWRPQKYWASGTKVTVDAKVYGHDLGGGLYGQQDVTASFTIGHSRIAIADSTTHHMRIYIDGVELKTIAGKSFPSGVPISMGRTGSTIGSHGEVIDFRTYSGPHVVIAKQQVVHMTSASYGITDPKSPYFYDELINLGVRISAAGEFVHSAPWSVGDQGYRNVSHGCINVSPTVAQWFFSHFTFGDVVDVKHTGKTLNPRDGLGDWVLSWSNWLKGSMLGETSPVPDPTTTPTPDTSASPTPAPSAS